MFGFFNNKDYVLTEDYKSLLERIETLENLYQSALLDIKHLEEENIETTNVLYELMENIRALDARIDILHETRCGDNDVQQSN